MRKRLATKVLTATALATIFAGGLFTGTASASTVLAQGCTGTVVGNMGDQVAVQGKDVSDLIRAGAKEQEVFLHVNAVDPDKLAQEITAEGALTVGQVPNAATGPLSGDAVASTVTKALQNADGLGWQWDTTQKQKTLDSIAKQVAGNCGLTLYAGNYSPATSAPPARSPQGGTTPPNAPGGSSSTPDVIAPPRDYGNIPAAVPGIAVPPGDRYPSGPPLPSLPPTETGALPGGSSGQTDVRNAGNASALAGSPTANTLQLPMLLAVVVLAGVSAALVRTWVLRKVS
ncbi:MAG TPA: hypothetical protein VJT49_09210 [Amycolatopsis sp.]|uniref:hypothetical protein n=1 Tax=Amycolatopsis sp. TaxID=37632 RepID=UPI002B46F3D9|nr:hypothetical protein [Amycolatopsis sp.]HKS45279.1 hypothetical protein [Amycolatopsis sp.]